MLLLHCRFPGIWVAFHLLLNNKETLLDVSSILSTPYCSLMITMHSIKAIKISVILHMVVFLAMAPTHVHCNSNCFPLLQALSYQLIVQANITTNHLRTRTGLKQVLPKW